MQAFRALKFFQIHEIHYLKKIIIYEEFHYICPLKFNVVLKCKEKD